MVIAAKAKRPELIWKCKKCGLLRSNHITHKHGVPLPKDKIREIEVRERKKEEARKSVPPQVDVHRQVDG